MFGRDINNTEELANQAQELFEEGDVKKAIDKINYAISKSPRNISLHSIKADMLFNSDNFNGTLEELKFMEVLDPQDPGNYSLESICYLSLGEDENALKAAAKAIKTDPEYPYSYYNRARALYNLGRMDEAVTAYKIAEEKNPSDFDVHKDLGELYMELKEYKLAELELTLARRYDPDKYDNEVIDELLEVKLARGDTIGYMNMLSDLYGTTGDFKYIKSITQFYIETGEPEEAEKFGEKMCEFEKDNLDPVSNLANIYVQQHKYKEANDVFADFIKRHDNYDSNTSYVNMLLQSNQNDQILSIIDEFIKKFPNKDFFLYSKFVALSNCGKHEDALHVIKDLYERNPDSFEFASNYAVELSYNALNDKSLEILDLLKEVNNKSSLEFTYYKVYVVEGLYDKAIHSLETAISIENEDEGDEEEELEAVTILGIAIMIGTAVDDAISHNYSDKVIALLDKLLETKNDHKYALYKIEKACIVSATGNPDMAIKMLEDIKLKDYACMLMHQVLKFENDKLNEYLRKCWDVYCMRH
jgi:tetratricopeptide (TPR) repeat protein